MLILRIKQTFFKQTLKAASAFLFATTLSAGFLACSSDDDNDNNNNGQNVPESQTVTAFDDLDFFQNAFVEVDSLGRFVDRSVGVVLNNFDTDTTHLFVGVNNIQEALAYFESSLAPDIARSVSATNAYTYTLTDVDGKSQGTVSFAPSTETGYVADLTTSADGLKHFKRVTFLNNSSWPFNSDKGQYRLGDVRYMDVNVDGNAFNGSYQGHTGFVCVREKSNGVKPLYVAITKNTMYPIYHRTNTLLHSKYCPAESNAKLISDLLRKDFDFYMACFEEAGEGPLAKGELYWYDKRNKYFVYTDQGCIDLSSGRLDVWDVQWHEPYKHVVLKIDWEND